MEEKPNIILPWLPENLEILHKNEKIIRTNSILQVNSDPVLKSHLEIVYKSLDLIFILSISYKNQTEDELTIQYLGIRLFNSIISSIKLLLTGYYQGSVIFQRDILEVGFLLDYFLIYPEAISDWKNSSADDRFRKYRPSKIRKALDRRDGFADEKRTKKYRVMCEYGAHATYPGFIMVAPKKLVNIGPFFDLNYLRFVLQELSMNVPLFSLIYNIHFKNLPPEFEKKCRAFMDAAKKWAILFLKIKWDDDRFSIIKNWMISITRN